MLCALHFQKKSWWLYLNGMKTTTQINIRKNEMKWNKQTKEHIEIGWILRTISDIIELNQCWAMHIFAIERPYSMHAPSLSLRQWTFLFSQISASINIDFSIYCLLLIFSAWNNRIIRSKCLLSQISSLNQWTNKHNHFSRCETIYDFQKNRFSISEWCVSLNVVNEVD